MKRRYKLLIIIFISFILVLFIYLTNYQQTFTYLFLGSNYNNLSTYDFNDQLKYELKNNNLIYKEILEPFIIEEYVQMLENNKHNINYYIKNANLIIISLGVTELNNYKDIDSSITIEYLNNIYKFLKYIRNLNHNNIFLINLYSNEYSFINSKIKKYTEEFKIYYLDQNITGANNEFYIKNDLYLNFNAHKNIKDYIINKLVY